MGKHPLIPLSIYGETSLANDVRVNVAMATLTTTVTRL